MHTEVMRITIFTLFLGMLFATPVAAEEIQDIRGDDADAGLYQDIIGDADAAAENGDYDEAIALWQKSIPLQQVSNEACRGARQQIYIEVAREAKKKIDRDDLSDDEVQQWFDSRAESLWEKSTCADE